MPPILRYLLLSLPLVACGGGATQQQENEKPPTKVIVDYSALKNAPVLPGSLRPASSTELSLFIKNGLRLSLIAEVRTDSGPTVMETRDDTAVATNTQTAGHFSTTNIQTAGVDEADTVKYDGKYIYLSTPLQYTDAEARADVKIFALDAAAATSAEVANIDVVAVGLRDMSRLYLVSDAQATTGLVTLQHKVNSYVTTGVATSVGDTATAAIQPAALMPLAQEDPTIDLAIYDVRTPSSPKKSWSIALQGDLLSSRKIGNILYLISSYQLSLPELNYRAVTDNERVANETLIQSVAIEKLLPTFSINGGASEPLYKSSDCLIPSGTASDVGQMKLINITAIDLSAQRVIKSNCISGNTAGIYTSLDSLYLGGSNYDASTEWKSYTVVHKFSLDSLGASYEATGTLEGALNWANPSYAMDEYKDYLRIVTTSSDARVGPVHHLTVMKKAEGRSELEVTATLPNAAQPAAIGKPGERIYSVRFNGDSAYIVTFRNTDPLYVLDLSQPTAPRIAGELEIPGFSTYLHPVGNNYLFALGKDVNELGRQTGLKVSLFDIRDIAKPVLASEHVFAEGSSLSNSDLYDTHALSFLQASDDQLRISLPLETYTQPADPEGFAVLEKNLQLFEINGLADNSALLEKVGNVAQEKTSFTGSYFWMSASRGVLHDDSVFYVYGDRVVGSLWPK